MACEIKKCGEPNFSKCKQCGKNLCLKHAKVCGDCGERLCSQHLATAKHRCAGKKRAPVSTPPPSKATKALKRLKPTSVGIRPPSKGSKSTLDSASASLEIHHIDVGQGEATLIRFKGGKSFNILIDGGLQTRGGETVLRYLKKLGVKVLDAIVCTHYDEDHYEGLLVVFDSGAFTVKKFLHGVPSAMLDKNPLGADKADAFLKRLHAAKGTVAGEPTTGAALFEDDDAEFSFTCLYWGTAVGGTQRTKNNNSLTWLIRFGQFQYYTGGDLESSDGSTGGEDALYRTIKANGHLCAFKCGHHGSHHSTSTTFVQNLKPRAAFISCGKHGHSHPRPVVLRNLIDKSEWLHRIYLTNCLHDRPDLDPAKQMEDSAKTALKGRVAGDDHHLGTLVLRVLEDETGDGHAFHVGFWNDGSWGEGGARWCWYKHVCDEKAAPAIDSGEGPDYGDHVALANLVDTGTPSQEEAWRLSMVTHHAFFKPSQEQKIKIALSKAKLYQRFKEKEGHHSAHTPEAWERYPDAEKWLWGILLDLGGEALDDFMNEYDGELDEEDIPSTIVSTLRPALEKAFDENFEKAVLTAADHPAEYDDAEATEVNADAIIVEGASEEKVEQETTAGTEERYDTLCKTLRAKKDSFRAAYLEELEDKAESDLNPLQDEDDEDDEDVDM